MGVENELKQMSREEALARARQSMLTQRYGCRGAKARLP
jgi:hypothetical protein